MEYRTSIGLDVHARTVAAAAFVPETGEVVERSFGCEAAEIAGWAASLPQPAHAVYESGPTGFALKRSLDALGLPCAVGAVSKMLKPAGDRVKTDRRDAAFLARMLAVGNVVECACPTPAQEAARDLARARADARGDLTATRGTRRRLPAPDKSECATQRADIRLEIAEAVWLNAPRSRQGSDIGEDPGRRERGPDPLRPLTK